jgi:hypothetical protein
MDDAIEKVMERIKGIEWELSDHTMVPGDEPATLECAPYCAGGLIKWDDVALRAILRDFARELLTEPPGPAIDIVFDRSPGPDPPRFIEVENMDRESIHIGEWLQRDDGYWVLRITVGTGRLDIRHAEWLEAADYLAGTVPNTDPHHVARRAVEEDVDLLRAEAARRYRGG